jgi:hypothetical protein
MQRNMVIEDNLSTSSSFYILKTTAMPITEIEKIMRGSGNSEGFLTI